MRDSKSSSSKFKPNSARLKLGRRHRWSNHIHRQGVTLNEIGAIAEIFQLDWPGIKLQPVEEMTLALRSLPQWTSAIIHREIGSQRISKTSKETTMRATKGLCVCALMNEWEGNEQKDEKERNSQNTKTTLSDVCLCLNATEERAESHEIKSKPNKWKPLKWSVFED